MAKYPSPMDRLFAAGADVKDRAGSYAERWPKMQARTYTPLTFQEQRDNYFNKIRPLLVTGHSEAVIAAIGRVMAPNSDPVKELTRLIRKFEGGQGG